jgi:hypothetical protein
MGLGEAPEEAEGTRRMKRTNRAQNNAFRSGSRGVCEAQLWKFCAPQDPYDTDTEPETEMVAALSLDQALKYMRYRHRDFNITKAESLGMIALLGGSPLD